MDQLTSQGATTFWESAKALGPAAVVILVIGGVMIWQLLKRIDQKDSKLEQVFGARVADGVANTLLLKESTASQVMIAEALRALQGEVKALREEIKDLQKGTR